MPKVLNKKTHGVPPSAVYVGRPSPFGNPFPMRQEADRDAVCNLFDAWLEKNPALIERAKRELRGKDLVCWCAPLRCHAETLLRIANEN